MKGQVEVFAPSFDGIRQMQGIPEIKRVHREIRRAIRQKRFAAILTRRGKDMIDSIQADENAP